MIKTIDHTERMRSSVNGNPRWMVFFTDGASIATSPDSSCAYGINNRNNLAGPVELTLARGLITNIRPCN